MAELELRIVGRILGGRGVGLVLEILLSTDTAQRVHINAVPRIRIREPVPFDPMIQDPGSGMGKMSGS